MKERPVELETVGAVLEGLLGQGDTGLGVVVCHPHPLYGGDMRNNVVQGVCEALWGEDITTLRFNFRGTGRSTGRHGGGSDEQNDVRAAVEYLEQHVRKIAVCGYSFGAAVGAQAGCLDYRVHAIAAIALPVGILDAPALAGCEKPKLLVAGGRDSIAAADAIGKLYGDLPGPKRLEVLEAADHFFVGHEVEVGRLVARFFKDTVLSEVTRGP